MCKIWFENEEEFVYECLSKWKGIWGSVVDRVWVWV